MKNFSFLFLLAFLLITADAFGAKRYWRNAGTSWKSTANWATTSGGAGPASVPGSTDTAYFDGNSGNCTMDSAASVKRLDLTGYGSGKTITHGAFTLTIGTGNAVFAAGTFSGGSANITCNGTITISGTAFTSTSGTLTIANSYTLSGTGSFTHNSGKVKFTATGTLTGNTTFNKVEFAPASNATYTIAVGTTLTVNDTVLISGSNSATFNTGTLDCKKNFVITNSSTGGGGTTLITFTGGNKQVVTGTSTTGAAQGRLPSIQINKSGDTLKIVNRMSVIGNWTYTAGIINSTGGVVALSGTKTITGSHSLYSVSLANGTFTIATGTKLTTTGPLLIQGSTTVTINGDTIEAKGDITVSNSATGGGGTATISIVDTSNQTFTGNNTIGEGKLPNIYIKKTNRTLTLASIITVGGNWTYVTGTINAGTSTVAFNGTMTLTGSHSLYNVELTASTTLTIAGGTILTTLGTLSMRSTFPIAINTGTIYAKGNITTTNSSASTGGTASIVINGTGTQTFTGSGSAGGGKFPHITIDKGATDTLFLVSVISITGNWTYTQGIVDPGTSSVIFYGSFNLDGQGTSGTMSFYDVVIGSPSTRTLTGNIDVNNNLTINSGTTLSAGSNSIYVGGQWNSQGTWTAGTSTVQFDGTGYRQITGQTSTTVVFYNLVFNKTAQSLVLSRPVKVTNALTLTKGRIKSSTTNYLELPDNATCSGGGVGAFVHGPVRKTGNDAFTFPLGDTTLSDSAAYHPLSMNAPSSASDEFQATYFPSAQGYGATKAATLSSVSNCQYWTLDRRVGTSTPAITLGWNSNCNNGNYEEMRVALWNGSQWTDLGQGTRVISSSKTGTVKATTASSFTINPAPLTIAYTSASKAYAVLSKNPGGGYFNTDGTTLYFSFDEEYKDADGRLTYTVTRISTDRSVSLIGNTNNLAAVAYGNNAYKIDLYDTGNSPLTSGYYMLEVTNEKNEKWYLRFKI